MVVVVYNTSTTMQYEGPSTGIALTVIIQKFSPLLLSSMGEGIGVADRVDVADSVGVTNRKGNGEKSDNNNYYSMAIMPPVIIIGEVVAVALEKQPRLSPVSS